MNHENASDNSSDYDNDSDYCLGIMAKYWEAGRVKTRLGSSIGMRAAATLHRGFCRHLAIRLADAGAERCFVIAPPSVEDKFIDGLSLPAGDDRWNIELQSTGDLGDRIRAWFQQRQGPKSLLIGADCPLIDESTLRTAAWLLVGHDVVLGPAQDGGYYLIGLRGRWRDAYDRLVDDMPWSSDRVFDQTCERARQSGLSVAALAVMEDIDTEDELERLRQSLENSADRAEQSLSRMINAALSEAEN